MNNLKLNSQADITAELLDYMAAEIEALAQLTDFQIDGYMDREVLNPEVGSLLNDKLITDFIVDESGGVNPIKSFSLSGVYGLKASQKFVERGEKMDKLKAKIRKIFCKVVGELDKIDELDIKEIIKIVIAAVLAAIGAVINPVVTPIIIAIIAYFVKKGYNAVCPI